MEIKNKIEKLFLAIDETEINQEAKRNMVVRLIKTCVTYLDIVVMQGAAIQAAGNKISAEISQELAQIDKKRTLAHNSLISQIQAVNRLCESLGTELIYNGEDDRRVMGDFSLELIEEYFNTRI